ncbi:hypothetical protein V7S43_001646 [Phytophthora oleae]|uniref:Peptidase A1 domain-containing protein n=1 Tax=Phytophthora oleae TaxID=2107226 RepID=A0ABD3G7I3_9STRA
MGVSKLAHPTILSVISSSDPGLRHVFAFYLAHGLEKETSEFHFGRYDLSVVGEGAALARFPVLTLPSKFKARIIEMSCDDFGTICAAFDLLYLRVGETQLTYWTLAVKDFHFVHSSTVDRSSNLCDSVCYAIIDTGTSFTYVPPQLYESVISEVVAGKACDLEQLVCENVGFESFPTLSFSFGLQDDGNFFHLRPQSYLDCDRGICTIELLNHATLGDDLYWWVLGNSFIREYYTVFDYDKLEVGIACGESSPECSIGQHKSEIFEKKGYDE